MEFDPSLFADLITSLPHTVRGQRLVHAIRQSFGCDAVGLLRIDGDSLCPVAMEGLAQEALGRRFVIEHHPRLFSILSSRTPVHFMPDYRLPDPYDGLLEGQVGVPLPVHDCMGVSLHLEGKPWGVLTLDAFDGHSFNTADRARLSEFALIAEAFMRVSRLESEVHSLRLLRGGATEIPAVAHNPFEILGQHAVMKSLLAEIDVVADSLLAILLLGETGVGKELLAHRIHRVSARGDGPLIHVNCAALPEALAESELFGHVRGAFSGAIADRAGRIEAAQGGTLFLDEVGELSLAVQAKLLRTLQNGEIQRLGEDRPRKVDIRVIAATNRQLQDAVREGKFRPDLYHRLSVYPVHIPPLRERGNDVLILAGRFLELNRARLGVRSVRLSEASEHALLSYSWPGNVRELEHVISRAALRAFSQAPSRNSIVTIEPSLLALDDSVKDQVPIPGKAPDTPSIANTQMPDGAAQSLREGTNAFQRAQIRQRLKQTRGNWAKAARSLGIDPSNLRKLAARLGIDADTLKD
jgi:anaerobic nitric oxide reductase transcription regulator